MYKINKKKYLLYCSLGLFYITLPILALLDLRTLGNGFNFFQPDNRYGLVFSLIVIGSMWINDTMAYVVGSLIGKTPFSKISPKKTWEGTIGGVILCIVVVGLVASFATKELFYIKNYHWFIIAGISAVAGTIGDLLESKLKRMANVKDSGSIMPGHGGFLDRFDSLLVTAPLVWFYVKLFIGVI